MRDVIRTLTPHASGWLRLAVLTLPLVLAACGGGGGNGGGSGY